MRKILLSLMIASPLVAMAADSPLQVRTKKIDQTVEDLAHTYFFHRPHLEDSLAKLISEQGVRAVVSATSEQKKVMNDRDVLMGKARQICSQLKTARTGEEFAEVFTQWDERERAEMCQRAGQVLARLDPSDRKALEEYLNTEYRQANNSASLDYQALFATRPFPSETSSRIMRSVCEDVVPGQD